MTKIRVYELAKELGVDNKIVITKAMELGIPGVKSHSNSMDPDEAEQVRRELIRSAVGPSSNGHGAGAAETLTKRVDKVTGATEAVVEKRSGNIIRRRRAGDEEIAALTPAPVEEPEVGAELFETKQPIIEDEIPEAEEPELEEPETEEEVSEVIEEETSEDEEIVATPTPEAAKTTGGPRILGRIELPIRRTPASQTSGGGRGGEARQARGPVASGNTATRIVVEDDEDDKSKNKAKKGKRREVTRFDLVNYDRETRRGPRGGSRDKRKEERSTEEIEATKMKASKRVVKMADVITVGELAKQMSVKVGEVIAKLMQLGVMATINQAIDRDITTIVAEEFEYTVEFTSVSEEALLEQATVVEEQGEQAPRAPVVTVMGHVDHGKTSLLDAIRSATVAEREHGGITQHIGAYRVKHKDKWITFIDTPGHAAFTSMRARGASVTDVVILVVAADDGVMPQTIEALNHAKSAKVPIVVAVNKMDKPGVNPDRVKQQLAEQGLNPEEWGGDTMFIPVSALKKTGLDTLLEGVLLQAEVLELKANYDSRARGTIIEARQDRGRGVVATMLVQSGTLKVGDIFVSGGDSGRVRSMTDHNGQRVEIAEPSTPVEITGFNGVPDAGDDFFVVESDAKAKQFIAIRDEKRAKEERALASGPISLEEFSRRANNLLVADLNVILKADVHGSVEAARNSLEQLSTEKVRVRVVHSAVGGITESDVQLAIASKAIIVGFNVRAEPRATVEAERAGIDLRFYRIIYEIIDDMKKAMVGLLEPIKKEESLGRAEVRQTFVVPKLGTIAGCYILDGIVRRNAFARLVRDGKVVHEGKMGSLRRFKDDVREVQSGYECGIGIDGYNDIKPGDEIQVYEIKEIAAEL